MKKLLKILLIALLVSLQVNTANAQNDVYYGTQQAPYLAKLSSFEDIKGNWAEKPIKALTALSIFRGSGSKFYPDRILTYEEALAVALRAAGQEENVQRYAATLSNGKKATVNVNADPWAYAYVDYALSKGILSKTDASIDWTAPAQRQVVAYWLGKLSGVQPVYGTQQGAVYAFDDWREINADYLPYIEPLVRIGAIKGSFSGNSISFRPTASLKRNELASMVFLLLPYCSKVSGITVKSGVITDVSVRYVNDAPVRDYYVENDDGSMATLEVQSGYDVPVLRGNSVGLALSLKSGDGIVYYVKGNNVLFAQAANSKSDAQQVEGVVTDVSFDRLTVEELDGDSRTYILNQYTPVDVNGLPGSIDDLKYGQSVSLKVVNGQVKSISIYMDEGAPGYVDPGSIRVYGQVLNIARDGDEYTINILTSDGTIKKYTVYDDVPVSLPERTGSVQDILDGDNVVLYFDSIYYGYPSKIAVQNSYGSVDAIIKGNLEGYSNGKLAISDVQQYKNGQWVYDTGYAAYSISDDARLYVNGSKVDPDNLSGYRSLRAYVILIQGYEGPEVGYVNAFNGYEYIYEYPLDGIDYAARKMTVGNNGLVYDDSTAVINASRLMPAEGLTKGQDLLVIASKDGDNSTARIVLVQTPQWPPYQVFRGKIMNERLENSKEYDGIYSDRFKLTKAQELENNQWEWVGSEYMYLNEDTIIMDNTSVPGRSIDLKDFTSMRYMDSNVDLRSCFTYAVTDGNKNAIAVNVVGNKGITASQWSDRLTVARVASVDEGNKVLNLEDARDYSEHSESWYQSGIDSVNVSKGVIVKNGRPADLSDIVAGDEVFVVRDGSTGYVVMVR
ncbi:S-layer homology domain-containing protein [Caldanaerobius polysaccharolyticus]|uniref:S-layer homology domain-containing protein n=1 Tax=Caldanaerobius polysaccharolyticus TaxID=44256 RepID=UPI00047E402B|nr:S-layer homology domain-containing protein [Caldanaerobius polysaccharolyticus]